MFAEHLSIAYKTAKYRRLDPSFTICHAYWTNDAAKEEQRVLAILRLVAGTSYKGAGNECFKMDVEAAIRHAAQTSPEQLREVARGIIRKHVVIEGKTVAELLDEMNAMMASPEGRVSDIQRASVIRNALKEVGLWPTSVDPAMNLTVSVYGLVCQYKVLLKAIPALKACTTVLDGLTF